MFFYLAFLNIYFRIFIFLLNPNNLWHWRIPVQGILQDLVAASVFYLTFKILFILPIGKKLKLLSFSLFVVAWTIVNYVNYEYADTFNKLLPLSWFSELINLNSMGPVSDLVADYLNFNTLFQLFIPFVVSGFLLLKHSDGIVEPLRIKYGLGVFLFGAVCQSATLNPDIQPMWGSTVHSQLIKYWYYSYDDLPYQNQQSGLLKPFSDAFKEVILEKPASPGISIPVVETKKPNIVFLLLESFRANEIGAFGSKLDLTPNFDRYAKKGVLFTDLYSSDHLTKTGQWSYLCGSHKHRGDSVLTGFRDHGTLCLMDVLKKEGYDNWWFHGQSASYDFQGYFMNRHHVDHIMDRLTFPMKAKVMGWGLADKDLMDHALDHLNQVKEPFFWIVQTQSNHHPFEVPEEFNIDRGYPETINKFLNTFHYTDYSLGYFLDRFLQSDAGKKSVIVIAADHGSGKDLPDPDRATKASILQKYQIPLLILYPEDQKIEPRQINVLGGQQDLLPTFLDILEVKPTFPVFGKSLVRDYKNRFSKGILSSSHWFLFKDKLYVSFPDKALYTKKGDKIAIQDGDEEWYNLSQEIDYVQDWMLMQKNSDKLYQSLINNGWTEY